MHSLFIIDVKFSLPVLWEAFTQGYNRAELGFNIGMTVHSSS